MRYVFVVSIVGIICLYYIWQSTVADYNMSCPMGKISDIAKRDLSIVGVYDKRLTITMKYWSYSILVAAYRKGKSEEVYSAMKTWNAGNHDDEGIINEGIELGRTQFLSEVDEASSNNTEVKFKVSSVYDYHDYPSYFLWNEYLYPDLLLKRVDEILGGEN